MAQEQQSRRNENNFRAGLQQLKKDYFGGQKVRPAANHVTSRQTTAGKCLHNEITETYQDEHEKFYHSNASENGVQGSDSENDEYRDYRKVSESAYKSHEYPRKGYQTASDYDYSYVSQDRHMVNSGVRPTAIDSAYGRGARVLIEDYVEEKQGRKAQLSPRFEREKTQKFQDVKMEEKGYDIRKSQNGYYHVSGAEYSAPRVYNNEYKPQKFITKRIDTEEEVYGKHMEREKMKNFQAMKMREKGYDIRKSQNNYYQASDAEYTSRVYSNGYRPQKYITDRDIEEEVYERNMEQSYDSSGSRYLRPEYWKQEIATVTEQFSKKKQSHNSKKDDYATLKIDISGKLKL